MFAKGLFMLKDYLKEQNISTYSLAKKIGMPYSTLNDLANGKVNVANCRVGFIKSLAEALNISMDDLYDICSTEKEINISKYNLPAHISVRNKKYYASFEYGGKSFEIPVCEVNEDSTMFINNFAEWDVEDFILEKELEDINEIYINAKR